MSGNSEVAAPATEMVNMRRVTYNDAEIKAKPVIATCDDDDFYDPTAATGGKGREHGADEAEEEEEEENSMWTFVSEKLDKFFVDHLPIESFAELPPAYMYYFGSVAYAVAIALFIYFTYTSYINTRNSAYISLDYDEQNCNQVPITVTGNYYADNKGNWVGTEDFVYSRAPYQIYLNNFKVDTLDEYKKMMRTFNDALHYAGDKMESHDLGYNLVAWMTFIRYYSLEHPHATSFSDIGLGKLQYIQTTADPQEVFDLRAYQTRFVSSAGVCDYTDSTTFDQANGLVQVTLNATTFKSYNVCTSAVSPEAFGYLEQVDEEIFTLSLEVCGFATALGVNHGFISLDNLETAGVATETFTYTTSSGDTVKYELGEYFDTRYPDMEPMFCVQNTTEIPSGDPDSYPVTVLCFAIEGNIAALPFLNQFGNSITEPEYCDCDEDYGTSAACNDFNILATRLFYNEQVSTINSVRHVIQLRARYPNYEQLTRAAFNASWLVGAQLYNAYDPIVETAEWLDSSFAFCQLSETNSCSMLVYNGLDPHNRKLSEYKYQLESGSCADTLIIDSSKWNKLQDDPPIDIYQNYFECYENEYNSLLNALGVASGNTSLAVPILVLFLLPLLYLLLVAINQVPPKREYTPQEKEEAIEILSLLLLRLRDGKTRGVRPNGVLMQLTKELIAAAKEEGGYPDSDDEDDYYEDDRRYSRRSSRKRRSTAAEGNRRATASAKEEADVAAALARASLVDSDDEEERARVEHAHALQWLASSGDRKPSREESDNDDESHGGGYSSDSSSSRRKPRNGGRRGTATRYKRRSTARGPNRRVSQQRSGDGDVDGADDQTRQRRKYRRKMGVFTKHIDAAIAEQSRSNVTRRNTTRRSAVPTPDSSSTDRRPEMGSNEASSSIFGYFFGYGSGAGVDEDRKESSEIAAEEGRSGGVTTAATANPLHSESRRASGFSRSAVLTITTLEDVPEGVQVLNMYSTESNEVSRLSSKFSRVPSMEELDACIDDMLQLFGEALTNRSSVAGREKLSTKYAMAAAADSVPFKQARALSQKLLKVDFEEFIDMEDKTIFMKLSNVLCMHASIELRCAMRQVAQQYAGRVAYNVGGKMLTAADLTKIM